MTQEEFIQKLRVELGSLPKHVVDEIVADYHEYFGDALAAGRSEADVVAALGDPIKLARELKAQATLRQWEARRSFGNLAKVIVSIAGLGLLQLFLLIPFMFYLLMLTVGYVVSGALAVAGFVTVIALGSHHLLGWPSSFTSLPFNFESDEVSHVSAKSSSKATDKDDDNDGDERAASNSDDARLAQVNMKVFRVVGDRFFLRPDDATRISVVTVAGPLDIKNDNGKLKIDSVGGGRDLFKVEKDGSWSIARADIVALDLKDADGDHVSVARIGSDPKAMAWDVSNHGDRLSFVQGAGGQPKSLSVHSGSDSVVIDSDHVAIRNGINDVMIFGPRHSSIGVMIYGFAMLLAGVVGLFFCVWLTRITWRALAHYVQRQLEVITTRLEAGHAS
ncbi:DUF1700 domain-containing protein [Paraburkholderia sp. BL21I4N1]|uniref:DUF1700 domain-containing protein n=1 Tax=Paraburkholderia sp. BL21I4N1 TaxID=1938801 RepID=UPI000CFB4AE2|nr:DUF1700 domain-containing protein [Paraburkholderia sp. BL21I4N1]PQV54632.1 putative membrane protein [Paraburkholderia sp. BL21I4N1]